MTFDIRAGAAPEIGGAARRRRMAKLAKRIASSIGGGAHSAALDYEKRDYVRPIRRAGAVVL